MQPLGAQPCSPGGRRCPETAGRPRTAQRPGPARGPSAPHPAPQVCGHHDLWAALGRVSVGFTPPIILFNRLLQPLRQRGEVSSQERLEDSDFGQGRAPWLCSGGPGWAGSSPGPTRAQVGLTSLSQAWPQDCKTKTPPLILCSLFSLARLRRLIPFIRSLTHPRKVLLVPADIEMNGSPATPRHSTVPTRKARSCFLSFILRIASFSGSPAVPMAKDKTTL